MVPPDESFRRLETATDTPSLPAAGHTVLTLILGDGCQTDASCRMDSLSPSFSHMCMILSPSGPRPVCPISDSRPGFSACCLPVQCSRRLFLFLPRITTWRATCGTQNPARLRHVGTCFQPGRHKRGLQPAWRRTDTWQQAQWFQVFCVEVHDHSCVAWE